MSFTNTKSSTSPRQPISAHFKSKADPMETPRYLHTAPALTSTPALFQGAFIPEAGDYWLAREKDEVSWPVVICDEEMTQEFIKGNRPSNALQANGTWKSNIPDFGTLAEERCFPALHLGTMKL